MLNLFLKLFYFFKSYKELFLTQNGAFDTVPITAILCIFSSEKSLIAFKPFVGLKSLLRKQILTYYTNLVRRVGIKSVHNLLLFRVFLCLYSLFPQSVYPVVMLRISSQYKSKVLNASLLYIYCPRKLNVKHKCTGTTQYVS